MSSSTEPVLVSSLEPLKEEDEKLYLKILLHHASIAGDRKSRKSLILETDSFVKRLEKIVTRLQSISMDDYNWLSETAVRWEVIYSSIFNIPKDIRITLSPDQLKRHEQTRVFTDDEVETWVQDKARELSKIRKVNYLLKEADALQKRIPSTEEEMKQDWRQAQTEFASQVLSGKINFVTQIASNSYSRLDQIWLREVKQLRAFLTWEGRGCLWNPDGGADDYYAACEQMREMLVNKAIKGTLPEDFEEAKAYLELHYLDDNGKVNREKHDIRELLDSKARQVWKSSGEQNPDRNWGIAETYVTQFYENIVPAVMMKDEEKTLLVLKAFQLSEASQSYCEITNAFETALAIYFLDADVIETIWRNSAGMKVWPHNWTVSEFYLPSFPIAFDIPKACQEQFHIDYSRRHFTFKGVMTEEQKQALITKAQSDQQRQGIEVLFDQSRLLLRESTL